MENAIRIAAVLSLAASSLHPVRIADGVGLSEGTQLLRNGMKQPKQWPHRHADDGVGNVSPLTYIEQKPAVILINAGRQLCADDFLIAETNLTHRCHKANYYTNNRVVQPDRKSCLATEPLSFDGNHLFIKAEAKALQVELLDETGCAFVIAPWETRENRRHTADEG